MLDSQDHLALTKACQVQGWDLNYLRFLLSLFS